jgi:hypothetical protein
MLKTQFVLVLFFPIETGRNPTVYPPTPSYPGDDLIEAALVESGAEYANVEKRYVRV